MPKIRWDDLPPNLRQHLLDRVGSFKICGDGELPKTFLLKGQAAKGKLL
jgi:hypothetical protein